MRRLGLSFSIGVWLVSTRAFAQPEAVKLDYREGAKCGGADAFVSQVMARSPRVRFANAGESASRSMIVAIEPHGARMVGRVELREADGTTTERSVTGASCEDVISAVGLVAAITLDPLASTSATATNANNATNASNSNTTNATSANDATKTNNASHANDDTHTNDAREREDDDALPSSKRRWSFGAGADAEVVVGAAPDALFAVPVFFELTRSLGEHFAIGGALRFERAGETTLDATGIGADFTWTAGAADVCFVWRAGRVRLHACARSHFGAIDAHGEGVTPERSATRPWVDLSGVVAFRVRIAGPVFVEATASAGVPLVQDRFFVEPNQTVFQVPAFTATAGGGLGFEIW